MEVRIQTRKEASVVSVGSGSRWGSRQGLGSQHDQAGAQTEHDCWPQDRRCQACTLGFFVVVVVLSLGLDRKVLAGGSLLSRGKPGSISVL